MFCHIYCLNLLTKVLRSVFCVPCLLCVTSYLTTNTWWVLLLLKYLVQVLTNLYLSSPAVDTIFVHSPVVGIVIFTQLFSALIPGHTLSGCLLISLTVSSLLYWIVYFLSFSISKSSTSFLDISFCSHSSLLFISNLTAF